MKVLWNKIKLIKRTFRRSTMRQFHHRNGSDGFLIEYSHIRLYYLEIICRFQGIQQTPTLNITPGIELDFSLL